MVAARRRFNHHLAWLQVASIRFAFEMHFKRLVGAFVGAALRALVVEGVETKMIHIWLDGVTNRNSHLSFRSDFQVLRITLPGIRLKIFGWDLELVGSMLWNMLVKGQVVLIGILACYPVR